jgi:hypothetical protein
MQQLGGTFCLIGTPLTYDHGEQAVFFPLNPEISFCLAFKHMDYNQD